MNWALEKIWQECLQVFKDNLDEEAYKSWFLPIKPLSFINDTLTLQLPSHFFFEYLEENYIDLISATLRRVIGPKVKLEYRVVVDNTTAPKNLQKSTVRLLGNTSAVNTENKPIAISMQKTPQNPFIIPGIQKIKIDSQLRKELNFDSFVEGKNNRVGINIGKKIAEEPGKTAFNPLFLHGPTGVGKTHLAHAIGLLTKELHPDKIVLYTSSHNFQTQYTKAVQDKNVNDFVNFYQNIDVFIIDDIQDLTGKDGTQKVFFQIFNYIHQQGKQLIMTADRPPVELDGFFDRLLTRFKWGLTAELEMPDYETRLEILRRKALENGYQVSDKILDLLASSITTSVRELEGTLLSILAHATADASKISVDLTKKILKNIIKEKRAEYSINYILEVISKYFDISEKAIKAKTRKREVVQARHLAMYYCKKLTNKSLSTIGAEFGGRDHSTVVHASKTVLNLQETDKDFRRFMEDIERLLKY